EFVTPRIQNAQTFPSLGLFVQDQWRLGRVTWNLGLRYDYLRSYVPAIDQPACFPINQVTHFDQAACLACWHDINPRIGFVYDLTGDGKTAVKASLGRYVGAMNNALANTYAPWAAVVLNTTRSWTDTNKDFIPNCDLANPLLNGECGAMANNSFGQLQVRSSADPNWMQGWGKRDYNWQAS